MASLEGRFLPGETKTGWNNIGDHATNGASQHQQTRFINNNNYNNSNNHNNNNETKWHWLRGLTAAAIGRWATPSYGSETKRQLSLFRHWLVKLQNVGMVDWALCYSCLGKLSTKRIV